MKLPSSICYPFWVNDLTSTVLCSPYKVFWFEIKPIIVKFIGLVNTWMLAGLIVMVVILLVESKKEKQVAWIHETSELIEYD